ncbi:N-6 DNA methylase [Vibrio splendidus]
MNYDLAPSDKYLYEQFYTSKKLGELMLDSLSEIDWLTRSIKIVDLCMGEGALLESLSEKAPHAKLYGSDIDLRNVIKVGQSTQIEVDTHHIDATTKAILEVFKPSQFDLVVGNPPFKLIEVTPFVAEVCAEIHLYPEGSYLEAEVFFLLLGLYLLREGGTLAYIIPDGVLNKVSLQPLRRYLVENFVVENIVEIEPKSFEGTEARTHLIVLTKSEPSSELIRVQSYASKPIFIRFREFIERGDYSYYHKAIALKMKTLKCLEAQIFRGRRTKKQLLTLNVNNFIHTSTINHLGSLLETEETANDSVIAIEGDIVIARVGTRCLGKFGVVKKGEFHISDCIIIIRCNQDVHRNNVLKTLKSSFGQSWIESTSKGVGARHITVKDLYNFPIIEK